MESSYASVVETQVKPTILYGGTLKTQSGNYRSSALPELPSSLERFAFWEKKERILGRENCMSCTNGGSGDCVACRE